MGKAKSNITFVSIVISVAFILSIFLFLVSKFDETRLLQSEDLLSPIVTSLSIIKEGNLNLNEYYDFLTQAYPNPDTKGDITYYLKEVKSNYYSAFPFTISFLLVPLSFVYISLVSVDSVYSLGLFSRVIGIILVSISAGYFYLLTKEVVKQSVFKIRDKHVFLLTGIFVFATNNFSLNAQGSWQHGFSNLFLTSASYYYVLKKYGLAGLLFGLAFAVRPTNLLPLVVFGLYSIFQYFKNTINIKSLVVFGVFAVLVPLLEYSTESLIFGSVRNSGYGSQVSGWVFNFPEGFLGIWLSTNKGILVFSPIFIYIFYYLYVRLFKKEKGWYLFDISLIIIFLHTFIMGFWFHWFGGYSWGYRMASDVLPYLTILLIPFMSSKYFKNIIGKTCFYTLVAISILIHLVGVLVYDGTWHLLFDKGPLNTSWVWSIKDSHIIFSIRRLIWFLGFGDNPVS